MSFTRSLPVFVELSEMLVSSILRIYLNFGIIVICVTSYVFYLSIGLLGNVTSGCHFVGISGWRLAIPPILMENVFFKRYNAF